MMNYENQKFKTISSAGVEIDASSLRKPKWAISYRAIQPLAMVWDLIAIFSVGILCSFAYPIEFIGPEGDISPFGGFTLVVATLFVAVGKSRDRYRVPELLNFKLQFQKIAETWVGIFLFLTALAFTMKAGSQFSRAATLSFFIAGFFSVIFTRIVWRLFIFNSVIHNRFIGRKILLITEQDAPNKQDLLKLLARHGMHPVKRFVLPVNDSGAPMSRLEVVTQAVAATRGSEVEEVIVSADPRHWAELTDVLATLRLLPLNVRLIPAGPLSSLFKMAFFKIGDTLAVELQSSPRTSSELIGKRLLDLLIAASALILFLPLLVITSIVIKLDSPGPVLFIQRRCGFNGRLFKIMKFRTMTVSEDGDTVTQATRNDSRVTRIGRWLRRSSIDELPQLLNVLQGSMSIVGPRPHALAHDDEFSRAVANYAFRHHVKPGLTGWAQVNGCRGQLSDVSDIKRRVDFDLWYIDNWSYALDIRIMLMTAIEIVRSDAAY